MESISAIEFDVRYRLSEYLSFFRDSMQKRLPAAYAAQGKSISARQISLFSMLIAPLGALAFFYKTARVGRCNFTISHTGVRRLSKMGEIVVPWAEIANVYCCKDGLILGKAKGGMPVPYRCLTASQREALQQLVAANGLSIE